MPKETNEVVFNLNYEIRVKLKPNGFVIWKEWFDSVMPKEWHKPLSHYQSRVDKDGYVGFQGWRLFEIFGPYIDIASVCPFEMDIRIENTHLEPVKPTTTDKDNG